MKKEELRRHFKERRGRLEAEEVQNLSRSMFNQFTQFSWPPVQTLFSYLPITKNKEPDTAPFVQYLQQQNTLCRVAVPVITFETDEMDAVLIDADTYYITNRYGIEEPEAGELLVPNQIDMVLVPLLAVDKNGCRIGYGKGYYDSFLKKCRHTCLRVGLSFFDPVDEIADIAAFDVPLTHCIMPDRVYVF